MGKPKARTFHGRPSNSNKELGLELKIASSESADTKGQSEDDFAIPPYKTWKIYVTCVDILLNHPNLIYDPDDENWRPPKGNPSKPMHLVIPWSVIQELQKISHLKTEYGMTAKKVLDLIAKHFEFTGYSTSDYMDFTATVKTGYKNQTITLITLPDEYQETLPWLPPQEADGKEWVAIYARYITDLKNGGSKFDLKRRIDNRNDAALLTNDRELRFLANKYGALLESYNYKKLDPFCGVRDITVPTEMLANFYENGFLSLADFENFLPDEPIPRPNEYIVMHPTNENSELLHMFNVDPRIDKGIARYNAERKTFYPLRFVKGEGKTPLNYGIAAYYDALNDPNIDTIVVTGPAGTGKTYTAIMHAIEAIKRGQFTRCTLITTQSSKNPLGAMPGDFNEKTKFLDAPFRSAIRSYVENLPEFKQKRENLRIHGDTTCEATKTTSKKRSKREQQDYLNRRNASGIFDPNNFDDDALPSDYADSHSKRKRKPTEQKTAPKSTADSYNESVKKMTNYIFEHYFELVPFEEAQGQTFNDSIVIIDEAQRAFFDDARTSFTRVGRNSKLIIAGDVNQIHEVTDEKRLANALTYAKYLFAMGVNCALVNLTEGVRSELVQYIIERERYALQAIGQG